VFGLGKWCGQRRYMDLQQHIARHKFGLVRDGNGFFGGQ
jgi:hypothetical protein